MAERMIDEQLEKIDSFVLVPVEPTEEMLRANADSAPTDGYNGKTWTQWAPRARWQAMLAAAPRPDRQAAQAAERIRDLEDRILLAKRLSYANYPGFVNPALNGEAIPQDILEYTDRICMEEGYVARVRDGVACDDHHILAFNRKHSPERVACPFCRAEAAERKLARLERVRSALRMAGRLAIDERWDQRFPKVFGEMEAAIKATGEGK